MFTLHHQDGDLKYELEEGGFVIEDGKLCLSIRTKAVHDEQFPPDFQISLDSYPVSLPLQDQVITFESDDDDELPRVNVYSTFHAFEIQANITIKIVSETEINVSFNVTSEDVNYYDDTAKPNAFVGEVNLHATDYDSLWLPI